MAALKTLTPEMLQDMRDGRAAGEGLQTIATRHGVGKSYVAQVARKHGFYVSFNPVVRRIAPPVPKTPRQLAGALPLDAFHPIALEVLGMRV